MNGTPVIFKVIEELCGPSFSAGPIGIVPPALGWKEPVGVVKSHIAYGIRTHCLPAQFQSATITAPRLPQCQWSCHLVFLFWAICMKSTTQVLFFNDFLILCSCAVHMGRGEILWKEGHFEIYYLNIIFLTPSDFYTPNDLLTSVVNVNVSWAVLVHPALCGKNLNVGISAHCCQS